MLRRNLYTYLQPYEDAVIFTTEGKIERAITHNPKDLLRNADTLQEIMGKMMKYPEARAGRWVWRISDKWESIAGWELDKWDS